MFLFFIGLLKVVLVLVCLLIVLLVLMQRPKQEGLGAAFAQGMMNEIGGAHTANILQKATAYLGALFFGLSLLLAILISREARADRMEAKAALELIEDKDVGTAGQPSLPLDIGSIPGVNTPLGGIPEDGETTPEGEGATTPEIPETPKVEVETPDVPGTPEVPATPETPEAPETPASVENPDAPAAPRVPDAPEVPAEEPGSEDSAETPAPPAVSGEDLETPPADSASTPAQPE